MTHVCSLFVELVYTSRVAPLLYLFCNQVFREIHLVWYNVLVLEVTHDKHGLLELKIAVARATRMRLLLLLRLVFIFCSYQAARTLSQYRVDYPVARH